MSYFDKQHEEEQEVVKVDEQTQMRYEKLDNISEELCPFDLDSAIFKSVEGIYGLRKVNEDDFLYGELNFRTLAYIFEVVKHNFGSASIKSGSFYDLGCVSCF